MDVRERTADYVVAELQADAADYISPAASSIRTVLLRLMQPPKFLLTGSLWGMGLAVLATTVFVKGYDHYQLTSDSLVWYVSFGLLLIWYLAVLVITGSRLSGITNIEGQSNSVCGHEILLAPIEDSDVLFCILRSHFPPVYISGMLMWVTYFAYKIVGAGTAAHQGHDYATRDIALLMLETFCAMAFCVVPLASLLWILVALLILRRVSLKTKPAWVFFIAGLLAATGGMIATNDFLGYMDGDLPSLLGGVLVYGVLIYLSIRFLGLPRRRLLRNTEIWVAFVLTSVVAVLFLLGSTSIDLFSWTWLPWLLPAMSFAPWNPMLASTDWYYPYFGTAWPLLIGTLVLQLIWLRLLWPMALEVIRESRAPQ